MPDSATRADDHDSPLTVGRLRQLLAEHHESDRVMVSENNLLYLLTVAKRTTAAGVVVLIERGDRAVF